jgi:mono/diheme cytochrome c family protein
VTHGRRDVLGTDHDIPPVEDCAECHSGGDNLWDDPPRQDELLDLPLGVGALQLNRDGSETTLAGLDAEGVLSASIPLEVAVVPGDATAREALGYLHGNCGGCHGGAHPAKGLTMFVGVGTARLEDTPTYQGTVDRPTDLGRHARGLDEMPETRVVPGDPGASALVWRMRQRGRDDAQMPPLGTEQVDAAGVATIEAWIRSL